MTDTPVERTCWMVEREKRGQAYWLYLSTHGGWSWVSDADEATPFESEKHAREQAAIWTLKTGVPCIAAEHMFVGRQAGISSSAEAPTNKSDDVERRLRKRAQALRISGREESAAELESAADRIAWLESDREQILSKKQTGDTRSKLHNHEQNQTIADLRQKLTAALARVKELEGALRENTRLLDLNAELWKEIDSLSRQVRDMASELARLRQSS